MMTVNQSHILDAKAKHYSYCPSFKSATTTWFNILIRLTNDSETYIGKARKELNRKWALIPAHLLYLGAISISGCSSSIRSNGIRLPRQIRKKNAWFQKLYGQPLVGKYRQQAVKVLGIDFLSKTNNFGSVMNVPKNGRRNSNFP